MPASSLADRVMLPPEDICRSGFPPDNAPTYRFYDSYLILNLPELAGWTTDATVATTDWADGPIFRRDSVGREGGCFHPWHLKLALKLKYRETYTPLPYDELTGSFPYTTGELIRSVTMLPGEEVELEFSTSRTTESAQNSVTKTEERTSFTAETKSDTAVEIASALDTSTKRNAEAKASAKWGWGSASAAAGISNQVDRHFETTRSENRSELLKTTSEVSNSRTIEISIVDKLSSSTRSTRRFANPNACHAVTYNYYYVDRHYTVTTDVYDVEFVLLVENHVPGAHPSDDGVITWDHDMFRFLRFSNNSRYLPADVRVSFDELMGLYEEGSTEGRRKERLESEVAGWAFDHKFELMHAYLLNEGADQRFVRMRGHSLIDGGGVSWPIWEFCENRIEGFFGEFTAFPLKVNEDGAQAMCELLGNLAEDTEGVLVALEGEAAMEPLARVVAGWRLGLPSKKAGSAGGGAVPAIAAGLGAALRRVSDWKAVAQRHGCVELVPALENLTEDSSWTEPISLKSLSEVAMGAVAHCSMCSRNEQFTALVNISKVAGEIPVAGVDDATAGGGGSNG